MEVIYKPLPSTYESQQDLQTHFDINTDFTTAHTYKFILNYQKYLLWKLHACDFIEPRTEK